MKIEKIVLEELSFLKFKVPDYLFDIIKNEVKEMKANKFSGALPYNEALAGKIEHEYVLEKSAEAIRDFFSHDRFIFSGKRLKLSSKESTTGELIPSLWVNFQKKHEFNPLHNHDGEVSFVIWVNIPYDLDDERRLPHAKSGTAPSAPCFSFIYSPVFSNPDFHVRNYRIEVDKSFEGTCILFSSGLQHMVTPFYTSDDYRISVSGNFDLV